MEPNSTRPTQERLREAAYGVVDKAIDAAAPAASWLDDKRGYVDDKQQMLAGYTSSNPAKALLIAFVAGLLIGKIIL